MPHQTKIATCCYCGSRAALVLDGARHELCCARCGAPLHVLKQLPVQSMPSFSPSPSRKPKSKTRSKSEPRSPRNQKRAVSHQPAPKSFKKPKPKKRRKSLLRWIAEEAKDVIEDIFD